MNENRYLEACDIQNEISRCKTQLYIYNNIVSGLSKYKKATIVAKNYSKHANQIYIGNDVNNDCILLVRCGSYCGNVSVDLEPIINSLKEYIEYLEDKIKDNEYKFKKL